MQWVLCHLSHLVGDDVFVKLHLAVFHLGVQWSSLAVMSIEKVLRPFGVPDHHRQLHGVVCGLHLGLEHQYPPRVEPIYLWSASSFIHPSTSFAHLVPRPFHHARVCAASNILTSCSTIACHARQASHSCNGLTTRPRTSTLKHVLISPGKSAMAL